MYFIHAENFSLSTKSNLIHIASEDDLRQLSNRLQIAAQYTSSWIKEIYIYIYMGVNNRNESDIMKKIEKQSNSKVMNIL